MPGQVRAPEKHRYNTFTYRRKGRGSPEDRKVRPTVDPGAVVRSLGDPPLGPNPATAAHHLTAIYEEAVKAATALAAANGLLGDDAV